MENSAFIEHLNSALWCRAIKIVSDEGHAFDTYTVIAKFEQLKREAAEWLADTITEHLASVRVVKQHLESLHESGEQETDGDLGLLGR